MGCLPGHGRGRIELGCSIRFLLRLAEASARINAQLVARPLNPTCKLCRIAQGMLKSRMVQAALNSQMPSGLKLGEGVAAGLEITQGQEPNL